MNLDSMMNDLDLIEATIEVQVGGKSGLKRQIEVPDDEMLKVSDKLGISRALLLDKAGLRDKVSQLASVLMRNPLRKIAFVGINKPGTGKSGKNPWGLDASELAMAIKREYPSFTVAPISTSGKQVVIRIAHPDLGLSPEELRGISYDSHGESFARAFGAVAGETIPIVEKPKAEQKKVIGRYQARASKPEGDLDPRIITILNGFKALSSAYDSGNFEGARNAVDGLINRMLDIKVLVDKKYEESSGSGEGMRF